MFLLSSRLALGAQSLDLGIQVEPEIPAIPK
jgi:hypothetical protein